MYAEEYFALGALWTALDDFGNFLKFNFMTFHFVLLKLLDFDEFQDCFESFM